MFNSYAAVGGGNPANFLVDFYTSHVLDRESSYTLGLDHNSSLGAIDGVRLENSFTNTQLDGSYKKRERDLSWGADLGASHQLYHWYGLAPDFELPGGSVDERQNYFMVTASGHIKVEDALFKNASARYRRFWDGVSSGENRAFLEGAVGVPLNGEMLDLGVYVDYVGGSFANAAIANVDNRPGITYSNLQVGVRPSLQLRKDDLSLDLGINLVYGMDLEASEGDLYIYPEVSGSYRLVGDGIIGYGGVTGELRQNSYYDFVEQNPFVSPTLTISPTDSQYNAYLGVKGQLMPNVSYNVKGTYSAENFSPLFKLNPENPFRTDSKSYTFGNSFEVFYDDIKTLGLFGEINVDINREFTLGLNAELFEYDTETDNPAWNRPNLMASLFMDWQIGGQWFTGVNLFFVGEREDVATRVVPNATVDTFPATRLRLDAFFDANAHVAIDGINSCPYSQKLPISQIPIIRPGPIFRCRDYSFWQAPATSSIYSGGERHSVTTHKIL